MTELHTQQLRAAVLASALRDVAEQAVELVLPDTPLDGAELPLGPMQRTDQGGPAPSATLADTIEKLLLTDLESLANPALTAHVEAVHEAVRQAQALLATLQKPPTSQSAGPSIEAAKLVEAIKSVLTYEGIQSQELVRESGGLVTLTTCSKILGGTRELRDDEAEGLIRALRSLTGNSVLVGPRAVITYGAQCAEMLARRRVAFPGALVALAYYNGSEQRHANSKVSRVILQERIPTTIFPVPDSHVEEGTGINRKILRQMSRGEQVASSEHVAKILAYYRQQCRLPFLPTNDNMTNEALLYTWSSRFIEDNSLELPVPPTITERDKAIGRAIRTIREELCMSSGTMAKKLGYNLAPSNRANGPLHLIEAGEVALPREREAILLRLAGVDNEEDLTQLTRTIEHVRSLRVNHFYTAARTVILGQQKLGEKLQPLAQRLGIEYHILSRNDLPKTVQLETVTNVLDALIRRQVISSEADLYKKAGVSFDEATLAEVHSWRTSTTARLGIQADRVRYS